MSYNILKFSSGKIRILQSTRGVIQPNIQVRLLKYVENDTTIGHGWTNIWDRYNIPRI
jgi:hypothetical protein